MLGLGQGSFVESTRLSAVIGFCKNRLAGYKYPKKIFFIGQLSRNAMRKPEKNGSVEK
jgi:hypothetical protein